MPESRAKYRCYTLMLTPVQKHYTKHTEQINQQNKFKISFIFCVVAARTLSCPAIFSQNLSLFSDGVIFAKIHNFHQVDPHLPQTARLYLN